MPNAYTTSSAGTHATPDPYILPVSLCPSKRISGAGQLPAR